MSDINIENIEETKTIQTHHLELERLKTLGLLVDLQITGTSMFTRAAQFTELGAVNELIKSRYSGLRKLAIPESYIKRRKSIEAKMRINLERHAFQITGLYPYQWIPFTAYKSWKEKQILLELEDAELKAEIIECLPSFRESLKDEFRDMAESAWKSIIGQGYEGVSYRGKKLFSQADFVYEIIQSGMDSFPNESAIEKSMKSGYITAFLNTESDLEKDRLEADRLRRLNETEKMELSEEQHQSAIRAEARRVELEAMRQAELEKARQELTQITSPYMEVFQALRNQIASTATDMLASIDKNGAVVGKISEQGKNLINVFDLMAVHDDVELKSLLENLRSQIESRPVAGPEITTENVVSTLEKITALVQVNGNELSAASRAAWIETW